MGASVLPSIHPSVCIVPHSPWLVHHGSSLSFPSSVCLHWPSVSPPWLLLHCLAVQPQVHLNSSLPSTLCQQVSQRLRPTATCIDLVLVFSPSAMRTLSIKFPTWDFERIVPKLCQHNLGRVIWFLYVMIPWGWWKKSDPNQWLCFGPGGLSLWRQDSDENDYLLEPCGCANSLTKMFVLRLVQIFRFKKLKCIWKNGCTIIFFISIIIYTFVKST